MRLFGHVSLEGKEIAHVEMLSTDGKGSFKYVAEPFAVGQEPSIMEQPDPTLHTTPPKARV